MRPFRIIFPLVLLASSPVQAAPGLPQETVASIRTAFGECTGSWVSTGESGRTERSARDLLPSLEYASAGSGTLSYNQARDLYEIAVALIVPATGDQFGKLSDGRSAFKCAARPVEAAALMTYLAGGSSGELRGPGNAYEWLGLAYAQGTGVPQDPHASRRWYLKARIHSGFSPDNRWSDGLDDDLLANIRRQGFETFLHEEARKEHGSAARRILAEWVLTDDPVQARALLKELHFLSLERLIELEQQGRVATDYTEEELAFWSRAARAYNHNEGITARFKAHVAALNGGSIPVVAERPRLEAFRKAIDGKEFADAGMDQAPVPLRALVDPQGRAIYVEPCRGIPLRNGMRSATWRNATMTALRMYDPARLPPLPVAVSDGVAGYGWIILPSPRFSYPERDAFQIEFFELPADLCQEADIAALVTPLAPQPAR